MYTVTYTTTPEGEELADVDVTTLSREEAHNFRLDLTHDLLEHGSFYAEDVRKFYLEKLRQLREYLVTD